MSDNRALQALLIVAGIQVAAVATGRTVSRAALDSARLPKPDTIPVALTTALLLAAFGAAASRIDTLEDTR